MGSFIVVIAIILVVIFLASKAKKATREKTLEAERKKAFEATRQKTLEAERKKAFEVTRQKTLEAEQKKAFEATRQKTLEAERKKAFEATRQKTLEVEQKKAFEAERKKDWKELEKILDDNGITCFYHFTDSRNLQQIRESGGLFSWKDNENKGRPIPRPGGGDASRKLDLKYGLEDYVRLSFCSNHPMRYIARKDGRISSPVILTVDREVAFLKETLFSDMNATKTGHHQGGERKDLERVRFDLVKQDNHFNIDEGDKPYYQAEVMVKTHIPLKYITFPQRI